jgi:hypothetical protein
MHKLKLRESRMCRELLKRAVADLCLQEQITVFARETLMNLFNVVSSYAVLYYAM